MVSEPGPRFSILIPTRNRPEALTRCLDAICLLNYPTERVEVIVVDDGSDPAAVVPSERFPMRTRLIRQRAMGPAAARNTGAGVATGDVLVFTADDCIPDREWLTAIAHHYASDPRAVVGGGIVNGLPDNIYSQASHLVTDYVVRHRPDQRTAGLITPNNLAVSRELYHRVGGFDPSFVFSGEDRDFCDRWLEHGLALRHAPDARVTHRHPLTLTSFIRQQYDYGRGSAQFRWQRGRHRLERLGYYLRLIASPWRVAPRNRPWRLSLLLLVSQVSIGLAFVTFRRR